MMFPSIPTGPFVDESGFPTADWLQWLNQLTTLLQTNYSNEGLVLPTQTTANIAKLTGPQSQGAMLYNATASSMMVNIAGTWKTVTVT